MLSGTRSADVEDLTFLRRWRPDPISLFRFSPLSTRQTAGGGGGKEGRTDEARTAAAVVLAALLVRWFLLRLRSVVARLQSPRVKGDVETVTN